MFRYMGAPSLKVAGFLLVCQLLARPDKVASPHGKKVSFYLANWVSCKSCILVYIYAMKHTQLFFSQMANN